MAVSPEHMEQVLAVLPCAAFVLDGDGRIIFQNRHAAALGSYAIGERLVDHHRVPVVPKLPRISTEFAGADGRRFSAGVALEGIELGGQPAFLAVVQGLPEASHEERLMRTPELLRQAVRLVQLGIFEHDHVHDTIYVSPEYRAIYGWSQDEPATLVGMLRRAHPEDLQRIQAAVARAHDPAGDGVCDAEGRLIRADGDVRWIRTRSQTYFGERDGQRAPIRTIGGIVDITETKRALEVRERLVSVLDATPDLVSIIAPDGTMLYTNRAVRHAFGIAGIMQLERRNVDPFVSDELRSEFFGIILPTAEREGVWRGEILLNTVNGPDWPYALTVLAHRSVEGKPEYFSAIAHDLTSVRRLEEQVRQAQKMEAIGRLAGGIAHDFNNLLSVILGYVELARNGVLEDSRAAAHLREAAHAAERAADLTRQMLAFSRKQVLRPRIVDLAQVLRETQPMLQRLIGEDIDLSTAPCGSPACVSADRSQLEQVLLNLVVNARDAMPDGGKLTVEVDVITLDAAYAKEHLGIKPGRYVMMAVSDTGMGMDAVTKARIFEPFFSTKAAGSGTGLGLATVFGIVKQSGGNIWVYSEPGRGTTFKVYLPHTEEQPSEAAGTESCAPRPPASATVLVVEDEAQLRSLIVTVLRSDGHQVLEAADPRSALELSAAYAGRIDLLLSDVVMPKMSGKQLADELLVARPGLRVVYMSGYTENTIVHRGVLDAGVHFIPKPVAPNTLREVLGNVLSDK